MATDDFFFRLARARVRARLEAGDPLSLVDEDIDASPGLDDEERAALWLYARMQCGWPVGGPDAAAPAPDRSRRRRVPLSAALSGLARAAAAAAALLPPWPF